MAAQRVSKKEKLTTDTNDAKQNTSAKISKVKVKANKISSKANGEKKIKSEGSLVEAQHNVRVAQVEVIHERQAWIEAERALIEAQESLAAIQLKVSKENQPPQVTRVRVSFIVRLTVNEHGQPQWTEVEHVESSRKQKAHGLDGESLVAFMMECGSPTIITKPITSVIPSPCEFEIHRPELQMLRCILNFSNIQVFELGDQNIVTFVLKPEKAFIVHIHFQIRGSDSLFLTTGEPSYEIRFYAIAIESSKSDLLKIYNSKLIRDVLEYTIPVEISGPLPGIYRLFTVINFHKPIRLAGFCKTIIQVV